MDFDLSSILDNIKEFLGDYGAPLALGAQGVGTMLQAQARKKIASTQQAFMDAEAQRQAALKAKAVAAAAAPVQQFTAPQQTQNQNDIASRIAAYISPTAAANEAAYVTGGDTAPTEVKDRMSKTLAQSLQKGQDYAKNLANLSAVGTNQLNNGIALGRAGQGVSAATSDSSRSSSVLPFELAGANRSGRGLAVGSDIANGLGGLAWLGAITRKPKPVGSGDPNYSIGAVP